MSNAHQEGEGGIMEPAGELGFLSKLSQEDLFALKQFVNQTLTEFIQKNARHQRLPMDLVRPGWIDETIDAITAKTGTSPEAVMVMALALYDVAIDAIKQGQRLVLVDQDYRFVREVTGLVEEVAPESRSHDKVAG